MPIDFAALRQAAQLAREHAYAPYSQYAVGAAVLTEDEEIVTGCNVENASYGLTMCAERVALFAARARGRREMRALCVMGPPGEHTAPCGACRQVMAEFNRDMPVEYATPTGVRRLTASELLPEAFALRERTERDGA